MILLIFGIVYNLQFQRDVFNAAVILVLPPGSVPYRQKCRVAAYQQIARDVEHDKGTHPIQEAATQPIADEGSHNAVETRAFVDPEECLRAVESLVHRVGDSRHC